MDSILERDSFAILKGHLSNIDDKGVKILPKSLKGRDFVDSIEQLTNVLQIDLIITSTKNDPSDKEVFLGNITGAMVKDLDTPVLIVPSNAKFKSVEKILMTIKSGKIKKSSSLNPLAKIKNQFNSKINLLQVKTPKLTDADLEIDKSLNTLVSKLISTNNATVFQGVLEFLRVENPDLICVIRRKRGFFKKLWENDKVKKVDFESTVPLLVLKGQQ